MGKQWKQWETLFSWALKSLWTVTTAMKLKDACFLEENFMMNLDSIKKQRHHFADKGLSSQSYDFSSSSVVMWELAHKEGWVRLAMMLLNYGVGEDSWEFLGQQGDPTSPS